LDLGAEAGRQLMEALVSDVNFEVVHEVKVRALSSMDTNAWLQQTLSKTRPEIHAEIREMMRDVRCITVAQDLSGAVKNWHYQTFGGPAQLKAAYIDFPNAWEEEIAAKSLGPQSKWMIQVIVPSHEVRLIQQSATKLLTKANGVYQTVDLFDRSSTMKDIVEHFNDQRNRIRVMVPAHLSSDEKLAVQRAATEVLG